MWIVIVFVYAQKASVYGPFKTRAEAEKFVADNLKGYETAIEKMMAP